MSQTSGIPIRFLTEAQGHVITVELSTGDIYKGKLLENEDNMNLTLYDVDITGIKGDVSHMKQVLVRGSSVRFIVVPEILKASPTLSGTRYPRPRPPIRGPAPKRARN